MNTAQKAVVGIGLGAIALMGIFPPWNLTFDLHTESRGIHSTKPAGCAPIYQPPKPPEEDARSILYTVSIGGTGSPPFHATWFLVPFGRFTGAFSGGYSSAISALGHERQAGQVPSP